VPQPRLLPLLCLSRHCLARLSRAAADADVSCACCPITCLILAQALLRPEVRRPLQSGAKPMPPTAVLFSLGLM
jgi:hypothetical protein